MYINKNMQDRSEAQYKIILNLIQQVSIITLVVIEFVCAAVITIIFPIFNII